MLDHILPVCEGGDTEPDNLITACEACNQGKAGRKLTERAVRPDADLLYLETEQEVAELERYQRAKVRKDDLLHAIVADLQVLWVEMLGHDWAPNDAFLLSMLAQFDPEIVEQCVRIVAPKLKVGWLGWRESSWQPYMWGVAKNIAKQREAEA